MTNIFFKKIFGDKKPEVKKENPADVLRREIETRRQEELARLILSYVPKVQVFQLGPNLPKEGKYLETIKFSEVPEGVKIDLLKYGQDSSSSGMNPVSWSGTRWVLEK